MANNNVRFIKVALQATYDNLSVKDAQVLYWIDETQRLYCGEKLYGTGHTVTETTAGLLSAEDYKKLQDLIANGPAVNLTPVDNSIVISDNKIGVKLSAVEGNMLSVKEDGLFVAVDTKPIENRLTAVEGRLDPVEKDIADLKQSIVGGIRYKGSVETREQLPTDAQIGDLYEIISDGSEVCWNGDGWFDYGTSHFTPVAGAGILINGNEIAVKIAENANGLVAVEGGLALNLATKDSAGALSAVDKAFIDTIPEVYATKEMVKDTAVNVKYNISATPEGTLVNYYEDEIRIMCPADAKFVKQNVGDGGNANMYYMTFTTYAPQNAVTFKEGDRGVLVNEVLDFENTAGTGIDKYGRKFKNHWFALATYDAATDTWNYFGKNSSVEKYIGWDYVVEYYDENGVAIARDSIRINLSNENCHDVSIPYYMAKYATVEHVEEAIQGAYSWGEL